MGISVDREAVLKGRVQGTGFSVPGSWFWVHSLREIRQRRRRIPACLTHRRARAGNPRKNDAASAGTVSATLMMSCRKCASNCRRWRSSRLSSLRTAPRCCRSHTATRSARRCSMSATGRRASGRAAVTRRARTHITTGRSSRGSRSAPTHPPFPSSGRPPVSMNQRTTPRAHIRRRRGPHHPIFQRCSPRC